MQPTPDSTVSKPTRPQSVIRSEVTEKLPPHGRLLLAAAWPELRDEAVRVFLDAATDSELDWGAFIDAAARHKLLPLVGRHVGRYRLDVPASGSAAVPNSWLYIYAYFGNTARNTALSAEFGKVIKCLSEDGIRFAVRKGFVLGEHVYQDIGLRRIADIDLLLERADAEPADEVLRRLGYVQGRLAKESDDVIPFSRSTQLFWQLNLTNQLPYIKPGRRPEVRIFNVDLCHEIFQPRDGGRVATASLLDSSREVTVCGEKAFALDPIDQLIDLCSHLHKEATGLTFIQDGRDLQISKFLDIALCSSLFTDGDWNRLLARVIQCQAHATVYYSLYFTNILYPDMIPARTLEALRPADIGYLDEFGTAEGAGGHWSTGFLDRLFRPERRHEAGPSRVPVD